MFLIMHSGGLCNLLYNDCSFFVKTKVCCDVDMSAIVSMCSLPDTKLKYVHSECVCMRVNV